MITQKKELTPIYLSEVINNSNSTKFKKKVKKFCEELIGVSTVKGMTCNDHIDFIIVTGLYVNDTDITPATGRKVYFYPSNKLLFKSYKYKTGEALTNHIAIILAVFPPVSSQEEARKDAFELAETIKDSELRKLYPKLIAFYNYPKGEVWNNMQDCIRWTPVKGYNIPTSVEDIENFSMIYCRYDWTNADTADDEEENYRHYKFAKLHAELGEHTIEELCVFINKCFEVPQESCEELLTKYNRWVANEPKRRQRKEQERMAERLENIFKTV